MDTPEGFSGRLAFALKVINLSPAALGAGVGVDKSVVSRWLSGKVMPSGHNLSRISAEIARHRPGFSTLAFEAPAEAFLAALDLQPPPPLSAPAGDAITLPFDAISGARDETARRGVEYFGHYAMYYWSFSRPGQIARMALMLRPEAGLIEARYGAQGFEFAGWALLLMNRLYMTLSEKRYQAMVFIVTNPGQQPTTHRLTGLMLGPSDRLMVPTVSPVVLDRLGPVTGDAARDAADFDAAQDFDPFAEGSGAPEGIRAVLENMVTATPAGASGLALLRVPAAES